MYTKILITFFHNIGKVSPIAKTFVSLVFFSLYFPSQTNGKGKQQNVNPSTSLSLFLSLSYSKWITATSPQKLNEWETNTNKSRKKSEVLVPNCWGRLVDKFLIKWLNFTLTPITTFLYFGLRTSCNKKIWHKAQWS